MYKYYLAFIIGISCVTLWTNVNSREFGDDWSKLTFPNSNYVEYQKKIEITATHAGIGNTTNYPLQLENANLLIFERDDNLGMGIHIREFGEFSVNSTPDGSAASYTIGLGPIRYFDLNGDGYIDARYDGLKEVSEIMFENRYVSVKTNKKGNQSLTRESLDGKNKFYFEKGQWQSVK